MKLQVSCSELVTHLNITDIDEIKDTLKIVENITGWKVSLRNSTWEPTDTPLSPRNDRRYVAYTKSIDIDHLEKGQSEDNYEVIGIRYSSLPREIIDKYVEHFYKPQYNSKIKDPLIPVNLIKDNAYIRINLSDGYCENYGLVFECESHGAERDYPAFSKIIDHFDSRYHAHDGGSTEWFEQWCDKNNYNYILNNEEY